MKPLPNTSQMLRWQIACTTLLVVLIVYAGLSGSGWLWPLTALMLTTSLLVSHRSLVRSAEQQVRLHAAHIDELEHKLTQSQANEKSHATELSLLGNYGNLLLGCSDLAEVLQVSQQQLSLLLPGTAGTIYPLIDGEGLAEATHLWGTHVVDSKPQASSKECHAMQHRHLHVGHSQTADSLCAHVNVATSAEPISTACIPLTAQSESLGWIYLSAPGQTGFPGLAVAAAAAEQLALALANLKLRQSLRDLSVRDPLTGLFNRRYLSESLGREIRRSDRLRLPLAVMVFDLDHFKNFNDIYGHAAGDQILISFAQIVQSLSREEDIACRQGGEEFILIMPEIQQHTALNRASQIMAAMSTIDILHDGQVLPSVTTSIGLAMLPEHGKNSADLLAAADKALYQAKAEGRNRLVVAGRTA